MRLWTTLLPRSLTRGSRPRKPPKAPWTRSNEDNSTKIPSATPLPPAPLPNSHSKVCRAVLRPPTHPFSSPSTLSSRHIGSALYIFGPTGPTFGSFQVELDDAIVGTYNASTTIDIYNTLLFFITHLDAESQHSVVLTNQVDGSLFALDYCVAVQADGSAGPAQESGQPTIAGTGPAVSATAVFPNGPGGGDETNHNNTNGSAGSIIGGVLGALAALVSDPCSPPGPGPVSDFDGMLQALLFFLLRYYLWKRAGGEGDCWTALCGPRTRVKSAAEEREKFKLWPMVSFKPKYDDP